MDISYYSRRESFFFSTRLYEAYADVYINCNVRDGNENGIASTLSLMKDGNILTRNHSIVDPYLQNRPDVSFDYGPIGNTPSLSLSVLSVARNDTGNYQCLYSETDLHVGNTTVYRSNSLFVMVRYYPDPTCSPAVNILKGAEVTVSCSIFEGTNELVNQQWIASANEVNFTAVSNEVIVREIGFVTSNLTLITEYADINSELTCFSIQQIRV